MLSSLLLAATAAVGASAAGTLGFSLGDKTSDGSCKVQADYEADLAAIARESDSRLVRTYSAAECNSSQEILPAAKAQGFQVVIGLWADYDESYGNDKAAVAEWVPQYKDQVYAVTVGSESMYRGTFTGDELLVKILDIKSVVGDDVKVGTADSWNKIQDGTANALIQGGADIILCNAFSYWQGQDISNSTATFFDDVKQAFGHVQELAGSNDKIELWVGETGWTSDGNTYEQAVPSVENADYFFHEGVCAMLGWGYNVFFFEAFDEPWKPKSVGENGLAADETHWGAMDVDRTAKYSLKC